MSLTDEIKDFALDLGYHAVGVAPAHPFSQFSSSFAERAGDYSGYAYLSGWDDPQNALPRARSIVVAVYDYAAEGFPPELVGKLGRVYQARCYLAPPTRIHGARPQLMRQFLGSKGCQVAPWPGGRSGIPDRQAAARAGVTHFGRNTVACAPSLGSFVLIHSFVIDRELDYDPPNEKLHCPPKCHLCQEACPTGAITSEIRVNPRRCIAYNTFATRGEETGVSPIIPQELRPKMGT
ncbi:MAG: epoxyqueuosine reductase, partial [Chloroflexi bacterium]|nr:epoxyqueuosine reductase [Chloroflexota bacterium]